MTYLSLAAIGTIIASCWNYIKGFINRFRSIFIVQIILEGESSAALMYLLWNEFKKSQMGDKRFTGVIRFVNPLKRVQRVGAEKLTQEAAIFWRGWKPLIVKVKCDNYQNFTDSVVMISYIRWFFNIDNLLIESLDKFNQFYSCSFENKIRGRFKIIKLMGKEHVSTANLGNNSTASVDTPFKSQEEIEKFRLLKWTLADLTMEAPSNPFTGYFFDKEVEELVKEVEFWLKSEKYFEKISVPFRRGWSLHGKAGCGKTSLVRAIAQKFDFPLVTFDLATMNNHDLDRNWREALSHSPCIILLEDIDSIFNGRKNVINEKGVTFDFLLNCIGGIENTNGIFTILTTNNIKKLDSAFIRPGRCGDRIIELKPIGAEQKLNMAKYILQECPENIPFVIKDSENDTSAKFQQKCADIALKCHWEKIKKN